MISWPDRPVCAYCGSLRDVLVGLVAALLVGLSTVLAGCGGSAYFSLGHQSKIRNCFLDGGVANLGSGLSSAKRELQKYQGNEIPVSDAVSIVARVTGLRVHLLRDDEISEALEHARQLIASEKVRQGPYNVKNEVVKASREAWADLTPEARSLVGTLWADKTGVDLVVTTLDHVQTKEKILSMIANILEQKNRYPLGRGGGIC